MRRNERKRDEENPARNNFVLALKKAKYLNGKTDGGRKQPAGWKKRKIRRGKGGMTDVRKGTSRRIIKMSLGGMRAANRFPAQKED